MKGQPLHPSSVTSEKNVVISHGGEELVLLYYVMLPLQLFIGVPVKFSSTLLNHHFRNLYWLRVVNCHFTSRLVFEQGVLRLYV